MSFLLTCFVYQGPQGGAASIAAWMLLLFPPSGQELPTLLIKYFLETESLLQVTQPKV